MNTECAMRRKKRMYKIWSLILLFLLVSCSNGEDKKIGFSGIERPNQFIKAAHYFSSSWPKTFWQEFERGQVDADLEQIKSDGFNTIILVLPWKGFELGFENDNTKSEPRMYQRLRFLLNKIEKKNLSYMLRLGFPHDFTPNAGVDLIPLCASMYENPRQQGKWLDYLQKIKNVTDEYDHNLLSVLISWEDFWCPHFVFPYLDENRRKELAQNTGYAQWLMEKDETLLKILLGKNETKKTDITVPTKSDPTYFYYIEFIDQRFDALILSPAKSVFPQAAMEIRIDKDPVTSTTAEKIWVPHNLYFDEVNHRGTYWAPFWGAENNGEKLSLERTLFNFEYFLKYVTNQGKSTNHVIEQFNFTDNTPYFPNNAVIEKTKVNDFLVAAVPLLKEYSQGYGVWAYRDYADNALFNASFEMGLDGWTTGGDVTIVGDDSSHELRINRDGFISQTFQPHERFILATAYQQLDLCLFASATGNMEIYVNNELEKLLTVDKGNNCFQLDANKFVTNQHTNFKLVSKSDLIVDEIILFGFVQKLGLYDETNQPGPYIKSIRDINVKLNE